MGEAIYQGDGLRVSRLGALRKASVRFIGTGAAPEDVAIEGLELPRAINTAGKGEVRALRLGPGEWLAIGWANAAPHALPSTLFTVPLDEGLACFGVDGPHARALLAGGTSLDLDGGVFAPGSCARTRFARATAIVECVAAQSFVLYVDRSIAGYFAAWLARHAPLAQAAG